MAKPNYSFKKYQKELEKKKKKEEKMKKRLAKKDESDTQEQPLDIESQKDIQDKDTQE
jgi:hypothetical protein